MSSVYAKHRQDARLFRDESGQPYTGMYEAGMWLYHYSNGYLHRDDEPARVWYSHNSKDYSEWYLCGKCYGGGKEGFWLFYAALSLEQQNHPNLHAWQACFAGYPIQVD